MISSISLEIIKVPNLLDLLYLYRIRRIEKIRVATRWILSEFESEYIDYDILGRNFQDVLEIMNQKRKMISKYEMRFDLNRYIVFIYSWRENNFIEIFRNLEDWRD